MIRSCLLQILSLCYLLLLLSVFNKKRKEKSLENKNFEIFSILTFMVLLFDGVKNYLLFFQDKYELLNIIVCKGFLISTIIWSTWLIIYISSLKKEHKTLKELFKSNPFYIILIIISLILCGVSIYLKPNYFVDIDKLIAYVLTDLNKIINKIDNLKNDGVTIDYVDIPFIEYSVPLYEIIALAEASSNLARFDGVRYGYSTKKEVSNIDEMYKKTRGEAFGNEVKRRMMIGSYVLSGKNAKTYYYKALKIRKAIINSFDEIFKKYDLIIGPTTTNFAYKLGESEDDAVKSFFDDLFTNPVNMAGLPAISIPIGFGKNNLPIGMQIIANHFDEATIYKLASYIEREY